MLNSKKLFIYFTIIFSLSLIAIILLMSKSDDKLNKESKAYVDNVLPVILKNLDEKTFLKFAAPELIKAVPEEKFKEIFKIYKKLGKFEKYIGSKGKAKKSFTLKGKKWIYANYIALAKFSNGDAKIKLTIIKEKNNWFIYYFKISSKAFNSIDNQSDNKSYKSTFLFMYNDLKSHS